jgi:ABC-type sugar transport system substrate-binding protein
MTTTNHRPAPRLSWLLLLVALAGALVVVGCGGDDEGSGGAAAEEDAPTYGVVTAVQHPYYNRTEEAMDPTCRDIGCETIFAQPRDCEAESEIQLIRDILTRGVQGLAVAACDAEGIESTVVEASESGIPVVTFDADCCQSVRAIGISNSDTEIGRLHAEAIHELLPEGGKIIVTVGSLAAQNVRDRLDGFKDNVDPNIEILEVFEDETTPERAQQIARDSRTKHPDLDLILDQAGLVAVVAESLKQQGLEPGEVQLVGINDFPEILDLMREGYITATVMLNSGLQGELALRALDRLRAGEKPSEDFFGTGGVIVEESNIDTYETEVEELNEQLRGEFEALWR